MSRTIAILAVIQLMLVILGFLVLGVVMKLNGYPDENGLRWTQLALLLRHYGLYLLAAPFLWTICAAQADSRQGFVFSLDLWLLLGFALAGGIIVLRPLQNSFERMI